MIKQILIALILYSSASAKIYSVDELRDIPKSYIKDYYIYKLLQKGVSKSEAKELLGEVKRLSPKIYKEFVPYIDKFKRKAYCQSLKPSQLIGRFGDCVKLGLSLYRATTIDPKLLYKISDEIKREDPELSIEYQVISKKSFDYLIKLPPKTLLKTFNLVGDSYRKRYFDKPFSKKLLNELIKYPAFNKTVEKIVRRDLKTIQISLLDINSSTLNFESNFLLGLNAIKHNRFKNALKYFIIAKDKAKYNSQKDKALFWQYLLTHDSSLLNELKNSHEINIYTLFAYEKLGEFPTNIRYKIDPKTDRTPFDIKKPFEWLKFKEFIKKSKFESKDKRREYLLRYNTPWSEPHIARLLYNYHDNIHYYLTPYSWYLNGISTKRKILIYSLARQESNFVPTEVSSSYALGMMQFMPFLAKNIAKELKITNFKEEMLFDPKIAYRFANIHLDYLEKNLKHPLLIAYAYNGGIGFTKREILQKEFFKTNSFDPFYSMEMIPNAQAREYGKRVLANYIIYSKLFKKDLLVNDLLEKIR